MKIITFNSCKFFVITAIHLLISYSVFAQLDTKFEAEDQVFTSTYEEKIGSGNASNGKWILLKSGPNGSLTLTVNGIPSADAYKLNIYHFNNNTSQNADFKLNAESNTTIVLNPSNWEGAGLAQLTSIDVNLNAGTNTFKFTRMTQNLHFDYFSVTTDTPTPPVHTYYVSNDGDDNNDGISESTPWQTLTKANTATQKGGLLQPGGKLLFNKGDTFEGQLIIGCSGIEENPIEIGSYGTGELPIISGSGNIPSGDFKEAVKMTNTSHILFNNIWIKNDRKNMGDITWGSNSSYGIFVKADEWGGTISGLTFRNLKITDVFGYDMLDFEGLFTLDYYKAEGISFDARKNDDANATPEDEIAIDDVLIEDCYFYNLGTRGISVRNVGGANNPIDEENRSMNYVIRNNHFEKLGGDGIVLAAVYNGLVENNEYYDLGWGDHTSQTDRYYGRGEGCWVWDARNIVIQYNKQYRNKGFGDTYGAGGHVDFYSKNVIFQYNYSEDTDGGFVEILGDCENTTFRHNVSVNDGHRTHHHNYTIWLSGYVGTGNTPVPSRNNYIYNNTVYVNNGAIDPQISIFAEDTYIYNNVFMYLNGSSMGIRNEDGVNGFLQDMQNGGVLEVSNNMFQGSISTAFKNLDTNKLDNAWPSFNSPGGSSPGDADGTADIYDIQSTSILKNAGKQFTPPVFPQAGIGIFSNVTSHASDDGFGNAVDPNFPPNIGASNSHNSNLLGLRNPNEIPKVFSLFPNPVREDISLKLFKPLSKSDIKVYDVQGRLVYNVLKQNIDLNMKIELPSPIKNGIYFLRISDGSESQTSRFILYR